MMALRDHLRADEDCALGAREPLQRRPQLLWLRDRVGVEPDPLDLGDVTFELALQPLRSRSDAGKLGRATRRTRLPGGHAGAAVVAAERRVAVERERDVAVRTASRNTAATAVERRCHAPPVEEEDRLAAAFREPTQLGKQRRRERITGLVAQ